MKFLLPAISLMFALAQSSHAGGELGGPARPLEVQKWVKGGPVDLAEGKGKQIYVIEFWATWCPPCRESIPHLTDLQRKFKDKEVTVIGISDEDVPVVKKFVARMGDKMDYVVAVDNDRETAASYMEAFGINGIPHAFIVDKHGNIVWEGHPMSDLDEALTSVVAGTYDISKAKKRALARQKLQEFYDAASEGLDDEEIEQLGREVEALDREVGGIEPGKPFNASEARKIIKFQALLRKYQAALSKNRSETELTKLEKQIAEVAPKEFKLGDFKNEMTLNRAFSDYYRAATSRGGKEKLADLGKQLMESKSANARLLNQWAWTLLTDERIKSRDLELATVLAKRAVEASDAKDGAILDTYARALFDAGKIAEAVSWQKKAVVHCVDPGMKKDLEATLEEYLATAQKK